MSNQPKLRLVLDIEYEAENVPVTDLEDNLHHMIRRAMGDGMLTGETEATIETWSAKVLDITEDVQHPRFTLWDWTQVVAQRSTLLGYPEWVAEKLEQEACK